LALELSNAELAAYEAWALIPGVKRITTKQLTEFRRFDIIGGEIVQAISEADTPEIFRKAITEIKKGDKDSAGYKAAIVTVNRTIDRIIETNPTFKGWRGAKERRLRDHIINNLLPNVPLGEATTTTPTDGGNGNVAGEENLSSSLIFGDPLKRIATDITKEDIGAVKRLGPRPEPTGRLTSTDFRQSASYKWNRKVEEAQNRDPEYLLPLLKKERDKLENIDSRTPGGAYWIQDRLGRINELIKKFAVMLGDEQAELLLPDPDQGQDPVVSLTQPRGMMNQGLGMIGAAAMFGTDQISMAAPDVDARYKA